MESKQVKTKTVKKLKLKKPKILKNKKKKKDDEVEMKRSKKRKKKKSLGHKLLILVMSLFIAVSAAAIAFALFIVISAPKFDVDQLFKSSSSIIYDSNKNVLAELGAERRDNVTYDELPEILIDAIIATEDSKYFQHNGIDLFRFSKAVAGQLTGHSDAGGGSTLTMQIVKNTYNGTVSSGIKGIIRKFTDIYMAVFKVETHYTKQEIMEFYVNQPFLGSQSYGVQQASETYFGKDVSELNLAEAATIAGLFQAPSAYDPYVYPDAAEERRDLVLDLMVRHKYITKKEAEVAKEISVADLLVGRSQEVLEYQGFVDTVVSDVERITKLSPYKVSMSIYSTMDKERQDAINDLYAGKTYNWVNDVVQCGIAVTDVKTGAVVAVGTGRNKTGSRTYNYATEINRQPGSTAKPIFDYGPAIEYAGWGTGSTVVDQKSTYSDGTPINNVDGRYLGVLTIKQALAQSRNVTALQAFQATSQEDKNTFATNLGIKPEYHDGQILESSAIGAFNGVSPLELSAAYGAFARGGYYIKPYSFTKIVYNDSNETYTYTAKKKKAMSEETAFMINMILKYAVDANHIQAGYVYNTDLASKTGTSSVDRDIINKYGLARSAIGDAWQVAYSPDYAIATWYGYDKIDSTHYLTENEGWTARKLITMALTKQIMKTGSHWKQPDGVVKVAIELGSNPVQLASASTPSNLRSMEWFKKGTQPTGTAASYSQLGNVSNLQASVSGNQVKLSWSEIDMPNDINPSYWKSYFEKHKQKFSETYYKNKINYNNTHIGSVVYEVYRKNGDGSLTLLGTTSGSTFTANVENTPSATFVVKSNYSIYKQAASSGVEVTAKFNYTEPKPEENTGGGETGGDNTGEGDNPGGGDNTGGDNTGGDNQGGDNNGGGGTNPNPNP